MTYWILSYEEVPNKFLYLFTVKNVPPKHPNSLASIIPVEKCKRSRNYVEGFIFTIKIYLAGGLSSRFTRLIAIASLICFKKTSSQPPPHPPLLPHSFAFAFSTYTVASSHPFGHTPFQFPP